MLGKLGLAVLPCLAIVHSAHAGPQLQYVWGGSAGTVVFIHGKADCSTAMSDCNGYGSSTGPVGYWSNTATGANMLDEATTKWSWNGSSESPTYYEAFAIGYDFRNQSFWNAAQDVGACLQDLAQGTNASGCNPNGYQRTSFHLVTHSAGATVIDRLLSTGWYGINSHVAGNIVAIAPALAGARAASALYGIDGYGNFCTSLVGALAGWAIRDAAAQSITRSAVLGEANKGYAGRSPIWFLKITTTGGGGSANNNSSSGVNEHDNDTAMGLLAGCLGYSSSDDMDGLLYWSDSDPTNNTGANGCPSGDRSCHYYSQFTGLYWHWFESWANHSHSRDDAYTTNGDINACSGNGCTCYYRTPGTCVGQSAY
jgi:hypothetical protein